MSKFLNDNFYNPRNQALKKAFYMSMQQGKMNVINLV